jgi:YHS domain-containing protein
MFEFIGLIGRVILILLIVRMVFSMFSGGRRRTAAQPGPNPSRGGRGDRTEKSVAKLVRDPQCGTYVAENNSVVATHGGTTFHFCSERCRDEYLASPRAAAV